MAFGHPLFFLAATVPGKEKVDAMYRDHPYAHCLSYGHRQTDTQIDGGHDTTDVPGGIQITTSPSSYTPADGFHVQITLGF